MSEIKKVYSAICAVQGDLAKVGIAKEKKNLQQGYMFRGIDDVYGAVAPLLSKHGLCILPRVIDRAMTERQTLKGGAMFSVIVQVQYDIVSSEDGSTHTVVVFGEAMDTGDKATNKAMSAAYKYACLQVFCIPTEGDNDADASTHAVKATATITPTAGFFEALSPEKRAFIEGEAEALSGCVDAGDMASAIAIIDDLESQEERVAIWSLLGSKTRAAIKKSMQQKGR